VLDREADGAISLTLSHCRIETQWFG